LPQDGSTVYLSLWYLTEGEWVLGDIQTHISVNIGTSGDPFITAPTVTSPPATVTGGSVTVSWDRNGFPGIQRWWVRAGNDPGGEYDEVNDFYNSGVIVNTAQNSQLITGLPRDGRTVYLSVWYFANMEWTPLEVVPIFNN